jgi:DNA-directed RNA polymerase specialized sigma24 family protein
MTISEDVLRVWMQEAKKCLRRYWDHPHFDDIVATAYLAMWEAISKAEEGSIRDVRGYAMRAAWYGAQAFLSSPANAQRTYNVFKQKPVAPTLYLEDVRNGRHQEWSPSRLVEPDFVPPLLERLAAEADLAKLSPKRRAAIWLCAYRGLTRDEACAQLGWPRHRIDFYLKGISRDAVPYSHPGGWKPRQETKRDEAGRFLRKAGPCG